MVLIGETERMLIRPLSLDDVPALTGILSDPEVMKHSVRGVCDEAATRKFVKWCLACYESHGVGPWALIDKESSAFIGFCGVGPERVGDAEEVNLGYRLARGYWGRGLATESTRAVLAHAFGIKEFESVVVIVEPEHVASLRVAEKAGFCGFREVTFHGKPVRLYRLTREEWTERHNTSLQPTSGRDPAFPD
ncbi:GNAT family N-acetyltransferase [Thiohalomonas denitrificans]|uniref:Protein N-acetyltransferase, RimJ/RimL family n=1 Tax=Thiohalomonas denitrificans TaxID=415747 RepID=A0A1G5R3M0_9GAMM|nr:GNAT family N-acetyltransferase [Thiohalomonas denitrificans]SCZ67919.1 Protein N-acetyltransferase, RimJ/RimL family [Thiohalomonas denitrificans]